MKHLKFTAISVLLLILLFFTGCSSRQTPPEETQSEKKIQIGITFDSLIIERWQRDLDVFVSAAQELGAEVNVQNANGVMSEQINQIQYFIQKKMDVIVIIMVTNDTLTEQLKKSVSLAQQAGIPVVAYDRLILNAGVDLYISFDNKAVGRLMAEHMTEHLAESERSEILQICGPLEDYNVVQIMEGFSDILKRSRLSVAKTEHAKGWLGETGAFATDSYLQAHDVPAGIMCGNDSIAGNAIQTLSEHRLAGDVCIVGQDADLDACQRIVEGTQCMTVYKPVEKLARRAAEMSVALAKGMPEQTLESIYDGSGYVPYERLEPIAVTKDNMDEIITGKYHEKSDIYLNIRD